MKKIISILLISVMLLSLCACGGGGPKLSIDEFQTGLGKTFGNNFNGFTVTEANGGYTFKYSDSTLNCEGVAKKDKNIDSVTITVSSVSYDFVTDTSAMTEAINKMMTGKSGELTISQIYSIQCYTVVMGTCQALGYDTKNTSVADFASEMLSVCQGKKTLNINGWKLSTTLDKAGNTAKITVSH